MTQKELGNLDKGLFFVVSAPAGTGKTTLVNMLTAEFTSVIRGISYTTRKPRGDEVDGVDYFFISEEEFEEKIENNDFLEYAKVFDSYYGTSREFVDKNLNNKKHVVLVIDTQGAIKLKEKGEGIYIFISPPDMAVLEDRLKNRNTDSKESIDMRLSWSQNELDKAQLYDYKIVNDSLDIAYRALKSIFIAEEHRIIKKG